MKVYRIDGFKFGFRLQTFRRSCTGVVLSLAWLALSAMEARTASYVLGTTNLLIGSEAQTNSVVLAVTPAEGAWTAATNSAWLHLTTANQSGTGSTNVIFSCDANSGTTRLGALIIGDQMLTVTQAGATYSLDNSPVGVNLSPYTPEGPATDVAGNLYFANTSSQTIEEWTPGTGIVTALVSSGISNPSGVAVDRAGNAYFADAGNQMIKKWSVASSNVDTLVSAGLSNHLGVAVDTEGNVYIADGGNNAVKEWSVASSNVITLASTGLSNPSGVAVDIAGNVYIADTGNNAIKEWIAGTSNIVTVLSQVLASSSLTGPQGVAVDGSGDLYIAGSASDAALFWVDEWKPATANLTSLFWYDFVIYIGAPFGVAVDATGDVYMSRAGVGSSGGGYVTEVPHRFVDVAARPESWPAGTDSWPAVLPGTTRFDAVSDQPWLIINGVTNGVVSYSFTANTTTANRTANISFLDQIKPITQFPQPALTSIKMASNGVIQFAFSNILQATFTVSSTTDLSVPFNEWTVVAVSSNVAPGMFQFSSQPTTNDPQRFYRVTSP